MNRQEGVGGRGSGVEGRGSGVGGRGSGVGGRGSGVGSRGSGVGRFPGACTIALFFLAVFAVQEYFLGIAQPLPLKKTNGPSLSRFRKHTGDKPRARTPLEVNSLYKPVTAGAS